MGLLDKVDDVIGLGLLVGGLYVFQRYGASAGAGIQSLGQGIGGALTGALSPTITPTIIPTVGINIPGITSRPDDRTSSGQAATSPLLASIFDLLNNLNSGGNGGFTAPGLGDVDTRAEDRGKGPGSRFSAPTLEAPPMVQPRLGDRPPVFL